MTANVQALDTMPWYKYKGPWLLMSIPLLTIVAGFVTLFLAINSSDGMVEDDYYKRGLAVNQDIARDQRAADLGLAAEAMLGMEGVRVFLEAKTEMSFPDRLVMRFKHATRAGVDQTVELKNDGSFFSGVMEPLAPGKWRLALEDTNNEWRIVHNFDPAKQESVRLLPLPVLAASMTPTGD